MCSSCSSSSCSSTCSLSSYFESASTSSSVSSSIPTSPSNIHIPKSHLSSTKPSSQDSDQDSFSEIMDQDVGFAHSIIAAEARSVLLASERLRLDQHTRSQFSKALQIIQKATMRTGLVDDLDSIDALDFIVERRGKVVWSGVGKSGLIARKLCSSMQSLGIPSVFLHPVEALHGDLGMLSPGRDVLIAISHSGGSPELQALLPHIKRRKCPLIAFTAKKESPLGKAADAWVDCRTASKDFGLHDQSTTHFGSNQKQQIKPQNTEVDSFPLNDAQSISLEDPLKTKLDRVNDNDDEEEEEEEEGSISSLSSSNSPSQSGILSNSASTSTSNVSTPSLVSGEDYVEAFSTNPSSKASSTEDVSTPIEQDIQTIDETCEAFPHAPAPTCSTSVAMAMGDALVVASARADARAERLAKEEFKKYLRKREKERRCKQKDLERQLKEADETIQQFKDQSLALREATTEIKRKELDLLEDARTIIKDRKLESRRINDELDAKGLRYAFARNHPGGSLGKELEMESNAN